MMQVTTDGTQPDSQQTPRPSLATARLRSSTLAGPCLEPLVRFCYSCADHCGKGLTLRMIVKRSMRAQLIYTLAACNACVTCGTG